MFYRNNTSKNTGLETTFAFWALVVAIVLFSFSNVLPSHAPWLLLIAILAGVTLYFKYQDSIRQWMDDNIILHYPMDPTNLPSRLEHDKRRNMTYPPIIPNSWYQLCDSDELPPGKVLEVRALNKVFVVWRGKDGVPVVQNAFCPHNGANIGMGGRVVDDDCLQCPFHFWKFDKDGNVVEIPYNKDPKNTPKFAKLKTYPCKEWCGLICVYFHADNKDPEYELPDFVAKEIEREGFKRHLRWNAGFRTCNVIDLVDQVCDHSHFNLLHGEFSIPWTLITFPTWFYKLFPIGIKHELTTFIGDEKEWKQIVDETGYGAVDKHLVFFYDSAGITWNGKVIPKTISRTVEMYVGPAIVCFHVPVEIGTVKVILSFTPVEGGVLVRSRTWISKEIQASYWKQWIAWALAGIAASQLQFDLKIISNRIRPRRPIIQPTDGPYNRIQAWLKQFFSEGSQEASFPTCGYHNDW